MVSFIELLKLCKADNKGMASYKLAVTGNCSTQHLALALKGYAYTQGIALTVLDTDYNQIDAQTIDGGSDIFSFTPDGVLIYMCTEKLYERFRTTDIDRRPFFADCVMEQIKTYWERIDKRIRTDIIQYNFPEYDDRIFGNYGAKLEYSFIYQLRRLNYIMAEQSRQFNNVHIADLSYIQYLYGRNTAFDERLYYTAKMTISETVLPDAARAAIDIICCRCGKLKKGIILDLDNTLWGGVIGDDGIGGIEIGELGTGRAFSDFQLWLKELKKRGILLAVCSKNNEDTAKEPFIKHPDMILRLDDISLFIANWDSKVENIYKIQQTLNIGMDSLVFIDDNPFERDLVRKMIPEITVPELPGDPALYLKYLSELNLFETAAFSEEDKVRTEHYKNEIKRAESQKQYKTYDDYLIGLDMKSAAVPFDRFNYPRIAQLIQRSNQFNLRTVRYTEAEIESIASDPGYITLSFTLSDKFGDHGLISAVIMRWQDDVTLFIDTWVMSCRVLKRGMEEFIINKIIDTAKSAGAHKIIGEYIKTPKNKMTEKIYGSLGFDNIGGNVFSAETDNFKYNTSYISEINK